MKIAVVFFIMFGLSVHSSGIAVKVLGTLDNNSLRITRLNSPGETIANIHSFTDIDGYNRSSEVPLSHTRRSIAGTSHEGILIEKSYFISFKNGTFQNFTLPCLSHELYDPVGLESAVVQLITCRGESRVLTVKVDSQGLYTVMTRITSVYEPTSSAAILSRDGASTAIYVSLDDNRLFYYSLAITGSETPYLSDFLDFDTACSNWVALSLSDTRVALHCTSSNRLYIFTGSDNGELINSLVTVDNIVIVRNNDLAASIKDHGVDFFSNDFSVTNTISIPVKRIEYVIIGDIPCFFLFHENGKTVYYLNSSNPLNDDSLELIVNKTGGNRIDLNSFYMYLSYFVYFVPPSMVHVVDFINHAPYSTVPRPSAPFLIDIWTTEDKIITSMTTPSSSSSSLSSSGFYPTSTTPIPSLPSTAFANSTVSTSTTTASVQPTNIHPSGDKKGAIIFGIVFGIVSVLVIMVIIFFAFVVYNKRKGRSIRMPSIRLPFPLSARSSPNSSEPDIATSVEATGGTQDQETGGGTLPVLLPLTAIQLPAATSSTSIIKSTVEATCTDVKETGQGTEDIAL